MWKTMSGTPDVLDTTGIAAPPAPALDEPAEPATGVITGTVVVAAGAWAPLPLTGAVAAALPAALGGADDAWVTPPVPAKIGTLLGRSFVAVEELHAHAKNITVEVTTVSGLDLTTRVSMGVPLAFELDCRPKSRLLVPCDEVLGS
jgi:hypothetical protein